MCDPAHIVGKLVAERYRVLTLIGAGSMGAVYEVEDTTTASRAALKVLLPELERGDEAPARFLREAQAMSLLAHRNIVAIIDRGRLDDGTLFIICELVRGVSLRALIADGVIEQRRALAIVRQVLEALAHAHDHGIIHRDVKPENIMLADGGCPDRDADLVKMLDFGVAKLIEDTLAVLGEGTLTRTGHGVFGSPLYIAPEVVLGRPLDGRADLYSVGVVLFEMLAGKPPFDDDDPVGLMRLHAAAPIPTLAAVAPEGTFTPQLEFVVSEALAKVPETRFASANEMIGAIDAALHSLDPVPLPTPKSGGTVLGLASPRSINAPPPSPPQPAPVTIVPAVSSLAHASLLLGPPARRIDPRWRRRVIAAGIGLFVIVVLVASVTSRGGSRKEAIPAASTGSQAVAAIARPLDPDVARRASDLLARGDAAGATGLLERELARSGAHADAGEYLVLGHARLALGRRVDAVAAYERAIALDPKLDADAQLKANAIKILDTRDTIAAILALELLASRVSPPAKDAILSQASNGKVAEVRHRAFAIAERDGLADGIDRVESWSLDLKQATSCDERRAAVKKLRATGDQRAVAALRRIRGQFPCVDRDVADAISDLEGRR